MAQAEAVVTCLCGWPVVHVVPLLPRPRGSNPDAAGHPASSAVGDLVAAQAVVLLVLLPSRSSSRLGKGPHSKGRPEWGVHAAPLALGFLLLLFSAWASWLLSMTSFFSSSLLVCVGIFKIAFIKLLNLFTSKKC